MGARALFLQGMWHAFPFNIGVVPFATLFGVVSADAGLDMLQTFALTSVVLAGASQVTFLELMRDGAGLWIALLAAIAVNTRMLLYSASLAPHMRGIPVGWRALMAYVLFDHCFQLSHARYEAQPQLTPGERAGYFLGLAAVVLPSWFGFSLIGAWIGSRIPTELPVDYAGIILFTALFAPAIRNLPFVVAALTAACVSIAVSAYGSNVGVIVGGVVGMLVGAGFEVWLDGQRDSRKAGS